MLGSLPGVTDVSADFTTQTVSLMLNQDKTSRQELVEALESLGFKMTQDD